MSKDLYTNLLPAGNQGKTPPKSLIKDNYTDNSKHEITNYEKDEESVSELPNLMYPLEQMGLVGTQLRSSNKSPQKESPKIKSYSGMHHSSNQDVNYGQGNTRGLNIGHDPQLDNTYDREMKALALLDTHKEQISFEQRQYDSDKVLVEKKMRHTVPKNSKFDNIRVEKRNADPISYFSPNPNKRRSNSDNEMPEKKHKNSNSPPSPQAPNFGKRETAEFQQSSN